MLGLDELLSGDVNGLLEKAKTLLPDDMGQLVEWLEEKDDGIRYRSFLLLEQRAATHDDVYPYWDVFLHSPNSFRRSIGIALLAENAKWDAEGRFDTAIEHYLSFCDDEKPVTVRKCIQSLLRVIPYKRHLCPVIAAKLMSIEIDRRKETQRKILPWTSCTCWL